MPGRVERNKEGDLFIKRIRHLKKQDGRSLENINFSQIPQMINGSIARSAEFLACNDMIGAASAVAKGRANKMPPNSTTLAIATGGGFGVGYLERLNGNSFRLTESRNGRLVNEAGKALEEDGGSARAVIRNFYTQLGLNEETVDSLVKKGDAKELFSDSLATKFAVKELNQARIFTVNKYAEAIAHLIKRDIVDNGKQLHEVVLIAPLARGISNFIERRADLFHINTNNSDRNALGCLIKTKLQPTLGDRAENLKISLDREIKDNTDGVSFLASGEKTIEYRTEAGETQDRKVMSIVVS